MSTNALKAAQALLFINSWSTPMAPQALHPAFSFLEKNRSYQVSTQLLPFQVKLGNHNFTSIFTCFSPILGFLILSEANPFPVDPLYPLLSLASLAVQIFPLLYLSSVFTSPLTPLILQHVQDSHKLHRPIISNPQQSDSWHISPKRILYLPDLMTS